jgi:carboxypeptidase Q
MEAARILISMGIKPRRTIRFALWAGEEQGLYGSMNYVERHLGKRAPTGDPEIDDAGAFTSSRVAFPILPQAGFHDMKAYFNIDNGSGKLRGLYAEGNFAAVPLLKGWLAPLSSLGASSVVANPTGSTDHVGMVRLGLPAFQFIQDPLDYESTVHHSSVDSYDHLRADDLRQASAVLASVLLASANSDKTVPANVMPTRPDDSDPYKYRDPASN